MFCKTSKLVKIEEILKKHVNNYKRRLEVFEIACKWILHFIHTVICVKSKNFYSSNTNSGLIRCLKTEIEYSSRRGWKFSHIFEMGFTFTGKLWHMTYEHSLEQPKPMIEWTLNKKIYKKLELGKKVEKCAYHFEYGT